MKDGTKQVLYIKCLGGNWRNINQYIKISSYSAGNELLSLLHICFVAFIFYALRMSHIAQCLDVINAITQTSKLLYQTYLKKYSFIEVTYNN